MEVIVFCFLQFVIAVIVSYSFSNFSEWACHKTPLEERLLERMVRLEFSGEQIEKGLKKTQKDVSHFMEDQIRKLEEFSDSYSTFRERVRVPLVAFSAYNPDDKSPNPNQVLVFKVNPLNEGTGYNPKTGVFTAPVKGLYQFSAHMCTHPDNYIVYAIVRDDEMIALSTQWGKSDSCSSVTALATINAGQGVKIIPISGSGQIHENQHRRNSFSGVLLHKQ